MSKNRQRRTTGLRGVCRAAGRVSVAGGRAAILQELPASCEEDVGYGGSGSTALRVESEKVSLPVAAGIVPLTAVVPAVVRKGLVIDCE